MDGRELPGRGVAIEDRLSFHGFLVYLLQEEVVRFLALAEKRDRRLMRPRKQHWWGE